MKTNTHHRNAFPGSNSAPCKWCGKDILHTSFPPPSACREAGNKKPLFVRVFFVAEDYCMTRRANWYTAPMRKFKLKLVFKAVCESEIPGWSAAPGEN